MKFAKSDWSILKEAEDKGLEGKIYKIVKSD